MKGLGKQIAIALVAAVLVFGVGYALFSDTITIEGTASATGSMNVIIDSATTSMTSNNGGGEDGVNTASVSGTGDSVTLSVPTLLYPGASVTFNVGLKNTGTLGAKVTSIEPTGLGETTDDLVITYDGIAVDDVIAGNNGTDNVTVTVTWNADSETGFTAKPFSIVINFTQQNPA